MGCDPGQGRKNMGLLGRMAGDEVSCLSRFEWGPSASVPSFFNIISIGFWGGCVGLLAIYCGLWVVISSHPLRFSLF